MHQRIHLKSILKQLPIKIKKPFTKKRFFEKRIYQSVIYFFTASFKVFPALNLGTFIAGIFNFSLVNGLIPSRAER